MSEGTRAAGARKLSVVVGAVESSRSLSRCLESVKVSCSGLDAELIVVTAGPEDGAIAASVAPNARVIVLSGDSLTPRLWSEGIACSTGDVVAILTGHCTTAPEWATSLLNALEPGVAATGGPMRLSPDASHTDAAIFFLRYSAFLDGKTEGKVEDIAGDNAAYVRRMIPDGTWSREGGFWEVEVNREILRTGGTIVWASKAVVEFGSSFGFTSICRHRFEHGRLFGRSRVSSGRERAVRIVGAAGAVPLVLVARIASRLRRTPSYRPKFVASLPIILALASCWAYGEARGALDAGLADRN